MLCEAVALMLHLHACVKLLGHWALDPQKLESCTDAEDSGLRQCRPGSCVDDFDAAAARLCQAAGALWSPQGCEEQLWALRRHTLPSGQRSCRWA